jgi:hypothetical protein
MDNTDTLICSKASDTEKTSEEEFTDESEFEIQEDCSDIAALTQKEKQDNCYFTNQQLPLSTLKSNQSPYQSRLIFQSIKLKNGKPLEKHNRLRNTSQ